MKEHKVLIDEVTDGKLAKKEDILDKLFEGYINYSDIKDLPKGANDCTVAKYAVDKNLDVLTEDKKFYIGYFDAKFKKIEITEFTDKFQTKDRVYRIKKIK